MFGVMDVPWKRSNWLCRWGNKNNVFRIVKSGNVAINSPQELANHADKLAPSIASLYLMLKLPLQIPQTFTIHKLSIRSSMKMVVASWNFSNFLVKWFQLKIHAWGPCMQKYDPPEKKKEWLGCFACWQWVNESCFNNSEYICLPFVF